jgi:phosphoribosylaminoimidazole (AIR) synthetase
MVAVVPADTAAAAQGLLTERGLTSWELGRIEEAPRAEVRLVGNYAGMGATWR